MAMRPYVRLAFIVVVLTMCFASPELALGDGNKLLKQCKAAVDFSERSQTMSDSEIIDAALCSGFMQGITQTNLVYQYGPSKPLFCLPEDGIANLQASRIVLKWLQEHPERLHEGETLLAITAFKQAFPCKKK